MKREARHVTRQLTPAQREYMQRARAESDLEKEEILRVGRKHKRNHVAALAELNEALQLLRASREAQGLSLADVNARSGITRRGVSPRTSRDGVRA